MKMSNVLTPERKHEPMTHISIKCNNCERSLKVPSSMIGKVGKCPACKATIQIESPDAQRTRVQATPRKEPPQPPSARRPEIDSIPTQIEEARRDRDRFAVAMSVAPDKFPIVEPYMMDYESARAIALQRPFPFTLFSDIALLTSHRLMVFRRFFTKVTMHDVNYVDFDNVTIRQGFFTSAIMIRCANGSFFGIDKLITDQALNLYRQCQDIETKARLARRQFQLEENRSRTNQLQINNIAPQSTFGPPGQTIDARAIQHRDISNVGDEIRDPFKLGE